MALTREQILKPRKMPVEVVPCPELGEGQTLTVKRLTGRQFIELSNRIKGAGELAFAHWIVATVTTEDGLPMFTEADAAALADQDGTLVQRLAEAAMRLNVVSKDDAAKN